MLVKCPGCLTTYRVSENLVNSNKPAFRCSRCKLIFALELKPKDDVQKNENAEVHVQLSTAKEPDLPFDSSKGGSAGSSLHDPFHSGDLGDSKDAAGPEPTIPTSLESLRREPDEPSHSAFSEPSLAGSTDFSPSMEPEPQYYSPPEPSHEEPPPEPAPFPAEENQREEPPRPEPWSIEDSQEPAWVKATSAPMEQSSDLQAQPEPESQPPPEPEKQAEEVTNDFAAPENTRETQDAGRSLLGGGPLSVVPYISLFGLLLLVSSLLTLMHQTQPERVEAYIRRIPWFGSQLLKNNHLGQGVIVGSLSTGYQRILGNREVFIISGKIYNQNPVSVGEVRVEGRIHDGAGKELARQAISVGNPISSKIIRDMTVREIAILQRLRPQKKFEVGPEGSAAFTIVFLKPSKEIKSFSCHVLFARDTV